MEIGHIASAEELRAAQNAWRIAPHPYRNGCVTNE